ncbi:GNAT family N-acetyltransferase, partial [Winogradskyella sp.]|uniref:GNAT family N-acetyltransferase n=1 Tax=Winogradskyella sp. TaxID=1883156 RepID=UPI003F697CEB
QFNSIEFLDNVVLVYKNNAAIGCGAFKKFDANNVEIKRMYTSVDHRDQGIATKILVEIEKWAFELGFISCILETGKRQKEAIKSLRTMVNT